MPNLCTLSLLFGPFLFFVQIAHRHYYLFFHKFAHKIADELQEKIILYYFLEDITSIKADKSVFCNIAIFFDDSSNKRYA